jgi:hypothetical protein
MADVFYLELEQLPDDAHVSTQCGDLQAGQLRCAVPRLAVRAALWQSLFNAISTMGPACEALRRTLCLM